MLNSKRYLSRVFYLGAALSLVECGNVHTENSLRSDDSGETAPPVDAGVDTGSEVSTDIDLPPWEHAEWEPYSDMPECHHVEVVQECEDGWCRIPAGCFVMGSPTDEWGRSPYKEEQLTVILDQSFEIMQYEVTLEQWLSLGFAKPEETPSNLVKTECAEDLSCPADPVGWWAAVTYANALSEEQGLTPCYKLEGCIGEPDQQGYVCDSLTTTSPTLYECEGYRLPTDAEWEYAARAGTQTAFYAGDIIPQENAGDCFSQFYLNDIAWYCFNSNKELRRVGQKTPNNWGLYDVLGNVAEWTSDVGNIALPEGPVHNLGAEFVESSMRTGRGGLYYANGSAMTAACRIGATLELTPTGYGFRLVRTLTE